MCPEHPITSLGHFLLSLNDSLSVQPENLNILNYKEFSAVYKKKKKKNKAAQYKRQLKFGTLFSYYMQKLLFFL